MRRLLTGLLSIVLLLAGSACGKGKSLSGPQEYAVAVDAASPADKNFQFAAFFPASLKVRPGDSIVFDNRSSQAPHTVSFGIAADRSNEPSPALPTGRQNPVVLNPCSSTVAPTASLSKCPTIPGAKPAPYTGKGYWNSGFLRPAVAPSGPKSITLKLGKSTPPGTYLYVCILHRPMAATITVVPRDADRDSPAAVRTRASQQISKIKAFANTIPNPPVARTGKSLKADAGWGQAQVAVNRFLPGVIEVPAGTRVSWYARSQFEPHTITFGSPFPSGADDPRAFAPSGARSGSRYTDGLANSGFVPPGSSHPVFQLTFARAGQYKYVCVLHPGMEGVVKVT